MPELTDDDITEASQIVGHIAGGAQMAPSEAALARIEAVRNAGTEVRIVACDIADPEECRKLTGLIDGSSHTLRGVIHAAGVLDDRTIAQMDWERFTTVLRPKTLGAWNLHLATLDRPLELAADYIVGNLDELDRTSPPAPVSPENGLAARRDRDK